MIQNSSTNIGAKNVAGIWDVRNVTWVESTVCGSIQNRKVVALIVDDLKNQARVLLVSTTAIIRTGYVAFYVCVATPV